MAMKWREPDVGVGETQGCAAFRMWHNACSTLCAPDADDAWKQIVEASPSNDIWHSLKNCIAYQAGVWQNLLAKGIPDVVQPAAFKLALVLRHTPTDLSVKLLAELLRLHPQSQDLTSYILALLTEDEAPPRSPSPPGPGPASPAPLRDLQLFGDCEVCALAAPPAQYAAHADLVRNEYATLSQEAYSELRVKILNQLSKIPKLYNTPEFEPLEAAARENITREINKLREHLATGAGDSNNASKC